MSRRYWLEIDVGEFGAWKSFFTHSASTGIGTNSWYRIGNYTSPDFHLEFRSVDDLVAILERIADYKKDPANLKQKISITIDEASLYFNARDFKSFPQEMRSFMVQLRKLNVHMTVIIQDLKQIDVNFRRLCYNVRKWYFFLGLVRMVKDFELLSEDANLNDPVNSLVSRPWFRFSPAITVWFRKLIRAVVPPISLQLGSHSYDTNELILPYYNVLDKDRLEKLFPLTFNIKTSEEYKNFIQIKRQTFIDNEKNSTLKKHYEKILALDFT